jgi:cellobiose-specific phosphotransferase system component IIC
MDANERPIVTEANKEKVRAGATGFGMRYVLLGGMGLVIVLFIAVALFARN